MLGKVNKMVEIADFIIGIYFGLLGLIISIEMAIGFFLFATGYSIIRRPMLEKRDAVHAEAEK